MALGDGLAGNPGAQVTDQIAAAADRVDVYEGESTDAIGALSDATIEAAFPATVAADTDFTIDKDEASGRPSPEISAWVDSPAVDIYGVVMELVALLREVEYVSNIEQALRAKLYTDITEGGTGLAEDVEDAIYDRASDRLEYELTKNYDAALQDFEAWGVEMPDGVLAANLREVLAEGTRRRAELSKDVMISQADLAQKNTQFAVTSGLAFEKQRMDFVVGINDALAKLLGEAVEAVKADSSKNMSQAQIDVQVFAAEVEAFKADVNLASAYMGAKAEALKAAGNQASANASLAASESESNLRVAAMLTSLRVEALKAVGNITAQKLASALSIINVSAGISAQVSSSESNNTSTQTSTSTSTTDNTNHNLDA